MDYTRCFSKQAYIKVIWYSLLLLYIPSYYLPLGPKLYLFSQSLFLFQYQYLPFYLIIPFHRQTCLNPSYFKIVTLTFKSPFSYLFVSVFLFSAKFLSRVVYSTTSSIQCNMVAVPLTPLNVLLSNSLVASKVPNPDVPVSAHLTSHNHFTLSIASSRNKFLGKRSFHF